MTSLRLVISLDTFQPLLDFYQNNPAPDYRTIPRELLHLSKGLFEAPEVPEDLYAQARSFGGVALLCMHAPMEVASKADIYEAVRGYVAFLKDM